MKIINKLILSFILIVIVYNLNGQHLSLKWYQNSFGENWDQINYLSKDSIGNIYIAGNYSGSFSSTKDTSKVFNGNRDIFIACFDSTGTNKWALNIASEDYCHISTITPTNKSKLLISGYFLGNFQLGTTKLRSNSKPSMFIANISQTGDVNWVKIMDSDFKGKPIFLECDNPDEIYFATGFAKKVYSSDINIETIYSSSLLLGKLDNNGELLDTLIINSDKQIKISDFKLRDSTIYITGEFEGSLYANRDTLISYGRSDGFFAELNYKLEFLQIKQFGGEYDDFISSVEIDTYGNIILSGSTKSNIVVNNSSKILNKGGFDAFVYKLNKQGKLVWADSFGGLSDDIVTNIALNQNDQIFILGNYRGEINKGEIKIKSSGYSNDIFIAKYNNDGVIRYIESIGDTNVDLSKNIILDKNLLIVGGNFFNFTKLIDKESDSVSGEEYFISQLFDCDLIEQKKLLPPDTSLCSMQYQIIADSGYSSYTWNGTKGKNKYKVDTSGLYILSVLDKNKCILTDSIEIRINELPDAFLGDDFTVNKGEIIYLKAPHTMRSYLWNDKSSESELEINTENYSEGEYSFYVQVIDSN